MERCCLGGRNTDILEKLVVAQISQDVSYSLWRSKTQSSSTAQHTSSHCPQLDRFSPRLIFHFLVSPKPSVPFRGSKTL
jgi:hypothetical protein